MFLYSDLRRPGGIYHTTGPTKYYVEFAGFLMSEALCLCEYRYIDVTYNRPSISFLECPLTFNWDVPILPPKLGTSQSASPGCPSYLLEAAANPPPRENIDTLVLLAIGRPYHP
jgi:hypothetical protein